MNDIVPVIATTPTIGSGDNVWNDRKELEEGGNITAINIKTIKTWTLRLGLGLYGISNKTYYEALCIGSIRTR